MLDGRDGVHDFDSYRSGYIAGISIMSMLTQDLWKRQSRQFDDVNTVFVVLRGLSTRLLMMLSSFERQELEQFLVELQAIIQTERFTSEEKFDNASDFIADYIIRQEYGKEGI